MEIQNIKKWGNSAGVRIPSALLKAAHLDINAQVSLREENGSIILEPVSACLTLEQLVAGITPDQLHEEVDSGHPQGSEAW